MKLKLKGNISEKYNSLCSFLKTLDSAIVAFSGGIDSALLLFLTNNFVKGECLGVTSNSSSVPRTDIDEIKFFVKKYKIDHIFLDYEESKLSLDYKANPKNRCYFCKSLLYSKINTLSQNKKISFVLDGTNASDISDYRPGNLAAKENNIISPLKDFNINKEEIRDIAKKIGLDSWNKAETACLASRVPYGNEVTITKLKQIDIGEKYIRDLGIYQVRLRHFGKTAVIQCDSNGISIVKQNIKKIDGFLKSIGFQKIEIDPKGYVRGSLNTFIA